MKIKLALLVLLAFCFGCKSYQTRYEQLYEAYTPYDSVGFIFNSYKYYVGTSTIKKVELLRLPDYLPLEKKYCTYAEAMDYYSSHDMPEAAKKLSAAKSNMVQQYQQQIQRDELEQALFGRSSVFGLSESEAYYYKKYKVESLNEVEFYCYSPKAHPKDGPGILGEIEKLRLQIIEDQYGVGLALRELVFSSKYNHAGSDSLSIDKFTKRLIESAFRETINMLPKVHRDEVSNIKISFQKGDANSPLWLSTKGKYVNISPYLIRATYVYAVSRVPTVFYNNYYRNLNSIERYRQHLDNVRYFNNLLLDGFKTAFYFVLSHELAHTYYSQATYPGEVKPEIICDCGAYRALRDKLTSVDAGIFTTMLVESVKAGMPEIWGGINPKEILQRVKYLEDLKNGVIEPDCDNIPKTYYAK